MAVQHGHAVAVTPHLGGAYGVEDGGGNIARQPCQLFIGLVLRARFPFLGVVACQRGLADDVARHAQAVCCHLAVVRSAQVIGGNRGRIFKIGALDLHRATAGGVEVAHAGREGRKAVQWLAKCIQRQRLHVVLQIGVRHVGVAARERTQL